MDIQLFATLFSLAHQNVFVDAVIILFGRYWEYMVAASFLAYLLIPSRSLAEKRESARLAAFAILSAVVARFGVVGAVRLFVDRERPFVADEIVPLFEHAATAGFPSGHATFFAALAAFIILAGRHTTHMSERRRAMMFGWFLAVSAVFIGIGRVVAGVHWPGDVLAGWIVGILISGGIYWLVRSRLRGKDPSRIVDNNNTQ